MDNFKILQQSIIFHLFFSGWHPGLPPPEEESLLQKQRYSGTNIFIMCIPWHRKMPNRKVKLLGKGKWISICNLDRLKCYCTNAMHLSERLQQDKSTEMPHGSLQAPGSLNDFPFPKPIFLSNWIYFCPRLCYNSRQTLR